MLKFILAGVLLAGSLIGFSQDRIANITSQLETLSTTNTGLNNEVELSVSHASMAEFIRGIGMENQLNVSVDPTINVLISNNFSNAKVKDVFVFLCQQYDLKINLVGNIISFEKYIAPVASEPPTITKKPKVVFNPQNDFLSLDLKRDTIDAVVEEITKQSLHNVIIDPKLQGKKVSVYIQNRPFDNALDKMALANGLKLNKTSDNFYVLTLDETIETTASSRVASKKGVRNASATATPNSNVELNVTDNRFISIKADQVPINELVDLVSHDLMENYFMYDVPKTLTSVFIENATYDEFLSYVLKGTDHTFSLDNDVYLIGKKESTVFRVSRLLKFENRRVESILETIPEQVKQGIQINEFLELNGLILSGSIQSIDAFEMFAKQLDVVVPVVTIDLIVADVTDTRTLSTGIYAGLGNGGAPDQSSGSITPGIGVDLSTGAINDVISGMNGTGLVNLGNVSPDFYLRIEAMEKDGDLKIETTPSIATLNGHESQITIGEQKYYAENSNSILNTGINQTVANSQIYKSVNADFKIKITPFVSEDEQVTLEIEFEQSSFTSSEPGAPPGKVTRSFTSMIRVKNGDMILLGGLGEKINDKSTEGLPLLSRIPILKWFFGKNNREKTKKQLTVFIRPTITY